MAEARPFAPAKLVCGILTADEALVRTSEERLAELFGPIDLRGPRIPFGWTDYYEAEMGAGLSRGFVSFERLVDPTRLAEIKIRTNALEADLGGPALAGRRRVNLDPGCLSRAALIMATTKDFAHRVPLRDGIYAHLEVLMTRAGFKRLEWTYPDFRTPDYEPFFMKARAILMSRPD
jgi:hypothetical protein